MIAAESPGGRETPKQPGSNGLGEDWDPRDPVFRGINLVSVPWLYGVYPLWPILFLLRLGQTRASKYQISLSGPQRRNPELPLLMSTFWIRREVICIVETS